MRGLAAACFGIAVTILALPVAQANETAYVEREGTFDVFCRTHTTAFNYAGAEDKEQFFELDVCGKFFEKFGFAPKADLYLLETIEGLGIYYAGFPNGTWAIAVK